MPSSSERTRRPGTPFTIIIPHAIRSGPLWPILPPASPSRWSPVIDWARPNVDNSRLLPDALTPTVQDLLGEAAGGAVVLEDGAVAFDLGQSKYSISGESNQCLLHLWSAERNQPGPVLSAASRKSSSA